MKSNVLFFYLVLLMSISAFAQSPQAFKYQAVIRNSSNEIIPNQTVSLKIGLLQTSETGPEIYSETHSKQTNDMGVVNLEIGNGFVLSGVFADILWGATPYYLKIELDVLGGTDYAEMGTSQLLSVPYALFAQTVPNNSISGNKIAMGADAAGDIIYFNGTNYVRLPIGTAGQVLKVQGGVPQWKSDSLGNQVWQISSNDIYSTNTGNVGIGTATPNSKLEVQGTSVLPNDTLFQVKNNLGQPVFIVFPDGARLILPDGSKAAVGGFAVSGRSTNKGVLNEYLVVTPDSTRVYVKEDDNRAAVGGFAVSGRSTNKGIIKNYFNVAIDTSEIIVPSKPRVLWYPTKEAFLAGRVYIPHRDSIGKNSLSIGYETKAVGNFSQAMGYMSMARGRNAMAIGNSAIANGMNSFAFGLSASALAADAYAIGAGAKASGLGSFAFGSIGRDTLGNIVGVATTASGNYAFAFGLGSNAQGMGSISLGANTNANGKFSLAMGINSTASSTYSAAVGLNAAASGFSAIALGPQTLASGINSVAIGYMSSATSSGSFAVGYGTTASNFFSTAIGNSTVASGNSATAIGNKTVAQAYNSTVVGCNNTIMGNPNVYTPGDPLFVVGNGLTELTRSDALVVTNNAKVGINTSIPNTNLDINGGIAIRKTNENITVFGPMINSEVMNTNASFIKLVGPTTAFNIAGIYGGSDGRIIMLYNATGQNMTIKHDQATSLPSNRIFTQSGADFSTTGNGTVTMVYDGDLGKWIVVSYLP